MRRPRHACTIVSTLALLVAAGCSPEPATPPAAPVEPTPAPAGPMGPAIGYTCDSGRSVAVAYPDAATAQLTWNGRAYALRTVQAASGARYTGSGVEWRTATADGVEQGTLSRLDPNQDVGVAVLERCSRPAPGPVTAALDPLTPSVSAGTPSPSAAPCKGPQLKLSSDGGDAGMGNRLTIVGVQNVGAQACSLTGYPTVTVQDARGRDLTAVRSEQNPGSYLRAGQSPEPVNLAPQAKAFFDIAWNVVPDESEGEKTCPPAARIRVIAPADTSSITLAQTFTPCGGRVRITPFRAAAEPAPATGG